MDALGCDAVWHHGLACGLCQLLSWLVTDLLHFQGLERTTRDNFGGGNTAWEEEKLAKYRDRSEAGAGWERIPSPSLCFMGGGPGEAPSLEQPLVDICGTAGAGAGAGLTSWALWTRGDSGDCGSKENWRARWATDPGEVTEPALGELGVGICGVEGGAFENGQPCSRGWLKATERSWGLIECKAHLHPDSGCRRCWGGVGSGSGYPRGLGLDFRTGDRSF